MRLTPFYVNFLLIVFITYVAYSLHLFGTDYKEYNELFKCINEPGSCPAEISIYNYSLGERFFFKMISWINSFFLVQLSLIYFTIYQLYLLAKRQKLHFSYILLAFFLAFLKDYYLNAFSQALALSLILYSFNSLSKKGFFLKILSTSVHPSSILYFIKIGKKFSWIFYIIISFNLFLFIIDKSFFLFIGDGLSYYSDFAARKIIYYLEHKSSDEGFLPLFIKTIIFLFTINTRYLRDSPYKSVYILSFLMYSSFLSVDILANRFLAVGKIFEILAFASLLKKPHMRTKIILSFSYIALLLYINFL